jgi:hypothetical protein
MNDGNDTVRYPLDEVLRPSSVVLGSDDSSVEALPPEAPPAEASGVARSYVIDPAGEPQEKGRKFYATDSATGERFYVGQVAEWGSRRGLSRRSDVLLYDRQAAEASFGLWAHFIWPTAVAESGARHIVVNAWDRAHFTWGFYQLAAHTANDNLILLMRELVKLPSAADFVPDLSLLNGRLAKRTPEGLATLEREEETQVGSGTETQLPDFMRYMNPDSRRLDEREVEMAARMAAWARSDGAVVETTIRVSMLIMRRKLRAHVDRFGLIGCRPEIAIWVSDMFHQGRGSSNQVRAALALPTFDRQIDALSRIDTTGQHADRLETVSACIDQLIASNVFKGINIGDEGLVP